MKKFLIGLIASLPLLSYAQSNFHYFGDAFKNIKAGWSNEMQGLCHDEDNYYITQVDHIWKIPRNYKIQSAKNTSSKWGIIKAPIPEGLRRLGSNHMGDCDSDNQYVYIPLEGGPTPKLLILKSQTLEYVKALPFSSLQKDAPWVSVSKVSGRIYSSSFNIPANQGVIEYILSEDMENLIPVQKFLLKDAQGRERSLERVQGGDIVMSRQTFWLVSDKEDGGLYGFDLRSGQLKYQKRVSYGRGFPKYEELEGLDALEADETFFPAYQGNLFLTMLDNNPFNNDLAFLKNYQY